MKKTTRTAFTLAEIMIVLTVIGILTAIILPSARNLMPDKNLMKFKKAHNTLLTAITELVNSDKYYLDGDLGVKPNGDLIDGTHEGDEKYFCNTLVDIINTKKANCTDKRLNSNKGAIKFACITPADEYKMRQGRIDEYCLSVVELTDEIILPDGTMMYQADPSLTFGMMQRELSKSYCYGEDGNVYSGFEEECAAVNFDLYKSIRAFLGTANCAISPRYKVFCIDIDGFNQGEAPFGYAIKADGKIHMGLRTLEWLEKDTQ